MDERTAAVTARLAVEFDGVLPTSLVQRVVVAAAAEPPRVVDLRGQEPRVLDLEEVAREDLRLMAQAVTRASARPARQVARPEPLPAG